MITELLKLLCMYRPGPGTSFVPAECLLMAESVLDVFALMFVKSKTPAFTCSHLSGELTGDTKPVAMSLTSDAHPQQSCLCCTLYICMATLCQPVQKHDVVTAVSCRGHQALLHMWSQSV